MARAGRYAKADMQATIYAAQLQALAMQQLTEDYRYDFGDIELEGLTYDKLVEEWDRARRDGREQEFSAHIAALIGPVVEQVINGSMG